MRGAFVAAAVAVAVLLAGRGGGREVAATVDGRSIPRSQVAALLAHVQEEFGHEGKRFPAPGTAAYRLLSNQALDLLVYRAELDRSAAQLGISVSDAEVEAALQSRARDSQRGAEPPGLEDAAFRKDGLREAFLYRRIYDHVTADVRVPRAQVERAYRQRRELFGAQGMTPAAARRQMARDLETAAKNARMARWVSSMKARFRARIVYREGFSAPGSNS